MSTYDALHRLIRKQIAVTPASGQAAIEVQTHEMSYPTPVRMPDGLPANYGHPTQTALTESAATSPDGLTASAPRTTTTATSYDDHGRVVSAADEVGTTTTTEYDDRYGLVISQTTTGSDGSESQMLNTLTADGANIATSTTSVGADGNPLSARQALRTNTTTTVSSLSGGWRGRRAPNPTATSPAAGPTRSSPRSSVRSTSPRGRSRSPPRLAPAPPPLR